VESLISGGNQKVTYEVDTKGIQKGTKDVTGFNTAWSELLNNKDGDKYK